MTVTFEKLDAKSVKVLVDGQFRCWLSRDSRIWQNGHHCQRIYWWEATVDGRTIKADTLTDAKERIRAAFSQA